MVISTAPAIATLNRPAGAVSNLAGPAAASMPYGAVPVERLWEGETAVCIGSGPSLCQADVDACLGRARVIAIKDAVQMAPAADVLYGSGADRAGQTWWAAHGPRLTFQGLRYSLDDKARAWASVLTMTGEDGLELDPSGLRSGSHSGYAAMNLAAHLGAKKIVLLGYDLQPTGGQDHFFGAHPHGNRPPFHLFLWRFPTIVAPLKALGITVVNASRESALEIFDRMPIDEALA